MKRTASQPSTPRAEDVSLEERQAEIDGRLKAVWRIVMQAHAKRAQEKTSQAS